MLIEELQRRPFISPHQIEQARWILAKRESGEKSVIQMEQCKCWNELSCLNEESAEWNPITVWMYNFTHDEGAIIQVRENNEIKEAVRIYHCPFCGRDLR